MGSHFIAWLGIWMGPIKTQLVFRNRIHSIFYMKFNPIEYRKINQDGLFLPKKFENIYLSQFSTDHP